MGASATLTAPMERMPPPQRRSSASCCPSSTEGGADGTEHPSVWRYATLSTLSVLASPHRGRAEDKGPLARITYQRLCRHLPIVPQSTARNLGIVEEMAHADLLVFAQRH